MHERDELGHLAFWRKFRQQSVYDAVYKSKALPPQGRIHRRELDLEQLVQRLFRGGWKGSEFLTTHLDKVESCFTYMEHLLEVGLICGDLFHDSLENQIRKIQCGRACQGS